MAEERTQVNCVPDEKINREENVEGGVPETVPQQLSEIVEGTNRVESRAHDLDNRVAAIEREVREDPDIKKLANGL